MSDIVDQTEAGDDPLEQYMMSLFSGPVDALVERDCIEQSESEPGPEPGPEREQATLPLENAESSSCTQKNTIGNMSIHEGHTQTVNKITDKNCLVTNKNLGVKNKALGVKNEALVTTNNGVTVTDQIGHKSSPKNYAQALLPKSPDNVSAKAPMPTPKKIGYTAEQIPSDLLLEPKQKRALQALLDQTLNVPLTPCPAEPKPQIDPQPIKSSAPASVISADTRVIAVQDKPRIQASAPNNPIISPQDAPLPSADVAFQDTCINQALKGSAVSALEAASQKPVCNNPDFRAHWSNHHPSWAQDTFDALLFKCRGVTLAIPLTALGHIYTHEEPLKQLPNTPSWMLGVKPLSQGQLKVIDAGAYFMPDRAPSLNMDSELYILGLAGCLWGFAVDTLTNPVTIKPEDVQWRPLNTNNPWLAGAIKKQMCVLIDAPALLTFL